MTTTIRPEGIRTEADYDEALERISALMGARAGTPEGDELEVLALLVERYEDEHYPIAMPSPAAASKFRKEQSCS